MADKIKLADGAGGQLMDKLIKQKILNYFGKTSAEIPLSMLDDSAVIDDIVFTTDSHTVQPIIFPGGDLGPLAVAGTINDVSVMGAKPIALSSGIPIVHNYESGYEEIFKPIENYNFFKTTSEAWYITTNLLGKNQSELHEIGLRIRRFALDRLTMKKNIKYMVDVLRSYKLGQQEGNTIEISVNPWGVIPQLT